MRDFDSIYNEGWAVAVQHACMAVNGMEAVALERIEMMRRLDPAYSATDDTYLAGFITACFHVKERLHALVSPRSEVQP